MRGKKWIAILLACLLLAGCKAGSVEKQDEIGVSDTLAVGLTEIEVLDTGTISGMQEMAGTQEEASETVDVTEAVETETEMTGEYDFTLCFAGDLSLSEGAVTTAKLDAAEGDISKCISSELLQIMQEADVMCLNNEFTYSDRGEPLPGKSYTFRANPERVNVLHDMGVDIVQLSNNHVYDYGKSALLDTLDTLENADIEYFGAGHNLEEAMEAVYVTIDDKVVAFVGASRAEKNKMTPQATDTKPGILRCYDTELFLESIKEADVNADFVIAVVHWGTEYSYDLEKVQLTTGKEYLDAGADAIIGGHSHCLQGMEYYDGKPIVYSLGNYWFNSKTLDTMLIELHFYGNDVENHLEMRMIPAIQKDATTNWVDAEEKARIFDFMESISINIEIDDEGMVREISKTE